LPDVLREGAEFVIDAARQSGEGAGAPRLESPVRSVGFGTLSIATTAVSGSLALEHTHNALAATTHLVSDVTVIGASTARIASAAVRGPEAIELAEGATKVGRVAGGAGMMIGCGYSAVQSHRHHDAAATAANGVCVLGGAAVIAGTVVFSAPVLVGAGIVAGLAPLGLGLYRWMRSRHRRHL
jgi:hypothetical protein